MLELEYNVQRYSPTGHYTAIQVIDIDNNGMPEVLAGNRNNNSLEIWNYNPVSNELFLNQSISFPQDVHDFEIGDLDNDGDNDIVVGLRFSGLYYVKNSNGTWSSPTRIDSTYSNTVEMTDLDQDGNPDILQTVDLMSTSEGLRIFYGDGTGRFTKTQLQYGYGAQTVQTTDINNDGYPDIIGYEIVINQGTYLRTLLNLENRQWSSSVIPVITNYVSGCRSNNHIGDLDNNSYVDSVETYNNQLLVSKGYSSGQGTTWTTEVINDNLPSVASVSGIDDFNGDGHLDIYAKGQDYFQVYLGDGEGNFDEPQNINTSLPGDYFSVDVGDINGDGLPDIVQTVGTGSSSDGFEVLFNIQNNPPVANDDYFTAALNTSKIIFASDLVANDTDADGDPLSLTAVNNAVNGTVSLDINGNVLFTPATDSSGTARFEYTVSDCIDTDIGSVTVEIGTVINGTNQKDALTGGAGDDLISGGNGADELFGGDGDDSLGVNGSDNGPDVLDGGTGNDVLTGGNGPDIFVLAEGEGTDTITDFSTPDSIGLSGGIGISDLSFSGSQIILASTEEVLAMLTGVDTTTLDSSNFTIV